MCREMSPDGERMEHGALVRAVASVDPGRGGGAPHNFARRRSGGRAGLRSPPARRHPRTRPPRLVIDRRPRSLGPSTAARDTGVAGGRHGRLAGARCVLGPRTRDPGPGPRAQTRRRRAGPDPMGPLRVGGVAILGAAMPPDCRGDTADYRHRKRQSSPHEFGPLALLCRSERSRPRRRAGFDHREFVANAARAINGSDTGVGAGMIGTSGGG